MKSGARNKNLKRLSVILGLVVVLVVHNFISDRRDEITEEITVLEKRIARAKAEPEKAGDLSQKARERRFRLIEGSTSVAGLGRLQGLIGDMARSSGIELLSVRPNPVIKYTYHEAIVLYIEAKGDVEGIYNFLKRLTSTEGAIFISKLSISESSKEESQELKLTMELSGLRRQ